MKSARNGYCYYNGIAARLEKYTVGDVINIRLDLDARIILIGKNGGPLKVAFRKLPNSIFYAYINFNDPKGRRIDTLEATSSRSVNK